MCSSKIRNLHEMNNHGSSIDLTLEVFVGLFDSSQCFDSLLL